MSITDELRHNIEGAEQLYGCECKHLLAIADRIDAEHERMLGDWDYWESTHIELPKDADGEPIHIGDVMEWRDSGDTLEVIGIGDNTLFYVDPEGDRTYAEWTAARNKRHHHAPTVEDVLREMLDAWGELPSNATNEAIVAKYAKRLTLAEGEDA